MLRDSDDSRRFGFGSRSRRLLEKRGVEGRVEFELDRAGHQHVVVDRAPLNRKIAAGQADPRLAAGKIVARGSDQGGAGGRAASPRQSGAALPNLETEMIARFYVSERDIRPIGKQRMRLQERADLGEVVAFDIF